MVTGKRAAFEDMFLFAEWRVDASGQNGKEGEISGL
jgi:hypothetical protein